VDPPALEDVPEPVAPDAPLVLVPDVLDELLPLEVAPDEPTPLVGLPELSSPPQAHAIETTRARAERSAKESEGSVRMTRTGMTSLRGMTQLSCLGPLERVSLLAQKRK
jgi:hypothetical protein